MKLTNPILFYILLLFTIVNISDAVTSMFILPGESNPIYLLFGSIWPIMILKLLVNLALWYYYKRNIYNSNLTYYMIIMILILGTLLLILGVVSNMYGILNPSVVQQGAEITSKQKVVYYISFTTLLYFLPMLFGIGAFIIYDKSRNKVVVDSGYFKSKPWWKRW